MKKDQVYFFTFLGLTIITFIVSFFGMTYLLEVSTSHFLRTQIESSKREAHQISSLVENQLESGLSKEIVIKNLQKSIANTYTNSGFVSMFDWSGVQIAHPNPEKIGRQILPEESNFEPLMYKELEIADFHNILRERDLKKDSLRDTPNGNASSEIIYLYPVKNTDWIVASQVNIGLIKDQIQKMKNIFILVYAVSGILIVILSLFMVRLINIRYEKKLELKNEGLSQELLTLSKLNRDLVSYKENVVKVTSLQVDETEIPEGNKKRIMAFVKDEIVSVETTEIALIYTENTITYIRCLQGELYTTNSSLDELYADLDKSYFFRANRQFILSIKAIQKILKYGNNQLKIEVSPSPPDSIIVSKNKASEFKRWLSL